MDKFIIEGGHPLSGEVKISGSKNATLPIMAATLLTTGESVLENVPGMWDIRTMAFVLRTLGARIKETDGGLRIKVPSRLHHEAPYELVRTMRASVLVLGPLLARLKKARVSLPGGCTIGVRPVDIHLKGLMKMGAAIKIKEGFIEARTNRLKGAKIVLDFASVGATENLMMAAVLAQGETQIKNAAREPEISDLADFLIKMGADIKGAGSGIINIKGTDKLNGACHSIIPDRVETGTFMIAAAATRGKVLLKGVNLGHNKALIGKLNKAGVKISGEGNAVTVNGGTCHADIEITTRPYPGFPTDLQPQMTSFLATCRGNSRVSETIFENRLTHVAELQRMGARIKTDGNTILIKGVKELTGASVMASDIRCGAGLVVAGLSAKKQTKVLRVYHIDRGYDRLESKLQHLGAKIRRVKR